MFPKKDHAIDHAQNHGCFRSGEIWIFDSILYRRRGEMSMDPPLLITILFHDEDFA